MKSLAPTWIAIPFIYFLALIAASGEGKIVATVRGRLARVLCMQYRLDQTFTSSVAVPALKTPIYDIQDIPCRIIRRHDCGAASNSCKKFTSIHKPECDEEAKMFDLEYQEGLEWGDVPRPLNQSKKAKATFKEGYVRRWPAKCCRKPTMWYKFGSGAPSGVVQSITNAMNYIAMCICIRFEPLRSENPPEPPDYVEYTYIDKACFSNSIGMKGGRQVINIGKACPYGTIIHEILHAIGFGHEHSRPDRDKYVDVFPKNAKPDKQEAINQKFREDQWDSFGTKYDYHSIMHYPKNAFSEGNKPTIVPKDPKAVIGQRCALSETDVKQALALYKCDTSVFPKPMCKMYKPGSC